MGVTAHANYSSPNSIGSLVAYHTVPSVFHGPPNIPAYPPGSQLQAQSLVITIMGSLPHIRPNNRLLLFLWQTIGPVHAPSGQATTCMYPSISVGDGHSIPVTNTGHSILPTPFKFLRLNNVLITLHIVKNLIYARQFVHDNNCTIEFDAFGFSVKDFMTRRVLLRCDNEGNLYPVTTPSPIPHAFLV
ncbi:hypothetical protein Tco_0061165, partial [Tanacetum coccineum]